MPVGYKLHFLRCRCQGRGTLFGCPCVQKGNGQGYAEYTNLVESYGIDEDWLDVTAEFTRDVHLYYEDNNQWFMERR